MSRVPMVFDLDNELPELSVHWLISKLSVTLVWLSVWDGEETAVPSIIFFGGNVSRVWIPEIDDNRKTSGEFREDNHLEAII